MPVCFGIINKRVKWKSDFAPALILERRGTKVQELKVKRPNVGLECHFEGNYCPVLLTGGEPICGH